MKIINYLFPCNATESEQTGIGTANKTMETEKNEKDQRGTKVSVTNFFLIIWLNALRMRLKA